MKCLLSILLIVAVSGHVGAEDGPPLPTPVSQLQAIWRDELSKRDSFKFYHRLLAQQLFEPKRIIVRETTGDAAFDRIDGTLAPSERKLILLGDLDQLRKQPKLTEVHNPGTFGNGFSAYTTPKGELLLFWIIPEG